MKKKCICCGIEKDISEYYSHPRTADGHLNKCKECCKKQNKDNRAHKKLQYALDTGKVIRPNKCSMCGIECIPQGHHYDYSKPLDVTWLCAKCHSKVHFELRRAERGN